MTRGWLPALVGGVVIVGGAFAVILRAGAPREAPPAVEQRCAIEIVSAPPGATLVRTDDGTIIGVTPTVVRLPKSNGTLPVAVRRSGYRERIVEVPLFSSSGRVDVTLTAVDDASGRD